MKSCLVYFLLLITSCQSFSQELKRRAFLGVQLENIPENGILVRSVVEKGSGALMGINSGDVILRMDGREVQNVDAFISSVSSRFEGDEIMLGILRNGKEQSVKGELLGKPLEKPRIGNVIYGTVDFKEGRLRSLLNLPPDIEQPPVVYFIQGYSCRSIDIYWKESNRLRRIVDGLVANGFAVYRIEKPGMGDSQTTRTCQEIGYHEEADAFLAGLRALKSDQRVDASRVFLFGHSLGGITAPVIAAEEKVKGIVNYGSVTTSWFEFLVKRAREHGRLRADDPTEIEAHVREMIPFLQDYLINKMPEEALLLKYEKYLGTNGTPYLGGRDYSFMQELAEIDITRCLIDCDAHVLAIHAEADFNCVDDDWAKHTSYIVNASRPGFGKWKLLPETSHSFAKVGDLDEFMKKRSDGVITSEYVDAHFNPELIDMIVEWVREIEGS